MSKLKTILEALNLNTFRFNFKYLPFKTALKLPILVSRHVRFRSLNGTIEIRNHIKTGMILIGFDGVGIFDNKRCRSIWSSDGKVIFNGKAVIGHGSKVNVYANANLNIGENFTVSANSAIIAKNNISFGNNCLISWDVLVMDTDSHMIVDVNDKQLNPDKEINIGNNVWIGCRATVLKGVKISDGSVIAACSVVTKNIDTNNCISVGTPNRIVKSDIKWKY